MSQAWAWFRRVVVFGLGIFVILDAVSSKGNPIAELIVGMIMVGALPLDDVLAQARRVHINGNQKEKDDAR
jgi:hypothetical protein